MIMVRPFGGGQRIRSHIGEQTLSVSKAKGKPRRAGRGRAEGIKSEWGGKP